MSKKVFRFESDEKKHTMEVAGMDLTDMVMATAEMIGVIYNKVLADSPKLQEDYKKALMKMAEDEIVFAKNVEERNKRFKESADKMLEEMDLKTKDCDCKNCKSTREKIEKIKKWGFDLQEDADEFSKKLEGFFKQNAKG